MLQEKKSSWVKLIDPGTNMEVFPSSWGGLGPGGLGFYGYSHVTIP